MGIVWTAKGARNSYFAIVIGAFIQYHYPDSSWAIMPVIAILLGLTIKK
ncbi:hypothetical protein ABN222_07435 [Providencia alcalifaciens]|nr:hypothetical protein [Providencia rettgeri]QLI96532.1 hypothetical protein H0A34_05615 [Providencia rettgeri]